MRPLLFTLGSVTVFALSACDCGPTVVICNTTACTGTDGGSGLTGDGGRTSGDGGSTTNPIVSITLLPANPTMQVTVLVPQTLQFTARATYHDGTTGSISGAFDLADPSLGTLEPLTGRFTANGVVGGETTVHFTPKTGVGVSTQLTVQLIQAASSADPGFGDAGTPVIDQTAQAKLLYPLDNVVFPQNVNAPTVQWSPVGSANDWFRVTYSKPHITVVDYVQNVAGFTFSEKLTDAVFSRVAETDPASPATLTVDRLDIAQHRVVAGTPIRLGFARGSVSGTVYYWALDEARLHRIPGGSTTNQPLFSGGIVGTAATQPGYTYNSCIACHQISRDGRYLAANGDQSYIFDLATNDPTKPNMPVATRQGYRWYFSSIAPNNSRVFASMGDTSFSYTDLLLHDVHPTGTVPTTNISHPSWSPDGTRVAFISNVTGWTGSASFTGGDMTLVNVNLANDVFSDLKVIHAGASLSSADPAGGNADCFPTWTPDSKFLMFAHTKNTRGTGDDRLDGSLYMMKPVQNDPPVRLAAASDSTGHAQAHYPNLSPFQSGGYYWVVFYSTRDYGNAQAGTAGTGRPQLWVSAVSTNFDGGLDPSSVPYWLPGQSTAHENADAVWAASACRATSESCATSSDCCSGSCLAGADGGFSCQAAAVCRREGESCETTADCCAGGLLCDSTIHVCQTQIN